MWIHHIWLKRIGSGILENYLAFSTQFQCTYSWRPAILHPNSLSIEHTKRPFQKHVFCISQWKQSKCPLKQNEQNLIYPYNKILHSNEHEWTPPKSNFKKKIYMGNLSATTWNLAVSGSWHENHLITPGQSFAKSRVGMREFCFHQGCRKLERVVLILTTRKLAFWFSSSWWRKHQGILFSEKPQKCQCGPGQWPFSKIWDCFKYLFLLSFQK